MERCGRSRAAGGESVGERWLGVTRRGAGEGAGSLRIGRGTGAVRRGAGEEGGSLRTGRGAGAACQVRCPELPGRTSVAR